MSKALRYTFLIHAIVAFLIGLPLLVAPGHFLPLLGWKWLDTMSSRLLGAALLSLAWSSWRCWQTADRERATLLLEQEAIFTILGVVGWLRELVLAPFPFVYWLVFAIMAIFAAAWLFFRFREGKSSA